MISLSDVTQYLPSLSSLAAYIPSLPTLPGTPSLTSLAAIPLTAVVYIWIFWLAYVVIMGFYRAYLDKRLNSVTFAMASPVLVVGYVLDMLCQYTLASLLFWDWPESWLKERMVTSRLQRYTKQGPAAGWRYKVATYICDNLLDPFDPTGDHCKNGVH